MKKLIFLIILLFPMQVFAISASSYVVLDQDSGRILGGKDYKKEMLIASTSKIMTALVAIENIDIKTKTIVNEDILKAYGSAIYLSIGETISIKDLLYGLLLRSGNDAALQIAINVSKNMKSFANLMNKKAKEIGMYQTNFINASGLEEDKVGNTSTAFDMALLTRYAMQNEIYKSITGTKHYQAKTNYKTYDWYNKNKLLSTYEYCTGGKTGFTKLAHRTLVTTASKDNKNLIIVTLNDGNDFADHKNLYEFYFAYYDVITILDPNNYQLDDGYYIKNEYHLLMSENEQKYIRIVNELDSSKGKVLVYFKDKLVHEEPIYKKEKEKTNKQTFFQKLINFFKNIFGDNNG